MVTRKCFFLNKYLFIKRRTEHFIYGYIYVYRVTARIALAGTKNSSMVPPWEIDPKTPQLFGQERKLVGFIISC